MPRYEFKEGTSNKFWEITLRGKSFTTTFGRIGTDGQSSVKEFKDEATAKKEYDKLVREKTNKGYELVEGGEGGGDGDDGDDDEKPAAAAPAGKLASNPELEKAILANPDADEPFLVYADWLQSQGDPRGELITLQHNLEKNPKDRKTQTAEAALLKKLEPMLLGDVAAHATGDEPLVSPTWRLGHMDAVRFATHYDAEGDLGEIVAKTLALPSAKFLRSLTIGLASSDGENYYKDVIKAVLDTKNAPPLRTLFIGDFTQDESEVSWSYLDDLEGLWKKFPALRSLKLKGGSMDLGDIALPELTEFTVETGGLTKANIKSIATAKWPKLEKLELWFGDDNYGADGDVADIAPILEGKGLPKLKYLGLKNAQFSDEIARALPEAKIVKQLETLDLSEGTLGDVGANAMIAQASAFKHLKLLDLHHHYMTDEVMKKVKSLCAKVETAEQEDGGEEAEDRYVALGE